MSVLHFANNFGFPEFNTKNIIDMSVLRFIYAGADYKINLTV